MTAHRAGIADAGDLLVTDSVTGRPIPGAEVSLDARAGDTDLELGTLTADAGGRVRARLLAAESYLVRAYGPTLNEPPYERAYDATKLVVTPIAGVARADVALRPAR